MLFIAKSITISEKSYMENFPNQSWGIYKQSTVKIEQIEWVDK